MMEIESLRQQVIPRLDVTREIGDEELYREIDAVLTEASRSGYLPLRERLYCRKALYDSFRRLDILSEALDEPGVTEVMVNSPEQIYVEKEGRLIRFHKSFSTPAKLEDVVQLLLPFDLI